MPCALRPIANCLFILVVYCICISSSCVTVNADRLLTHMINSWTRLVGVWLTNRGCPCVPSLATAA